MDKHHGIQVSEKHNADGLNRAFSPTELANNAPIHPKVNMLGAMDLDDVIFQAVVRVKCAYTDRTQKDRRCCRCFGTGVSAFEGVQELPGSFSVIFDEIFPVRHMRVTR
jgi:hypothetical protein